MTYDHGASLPKVLLDDLGVLHCGHSPTVADVNTNGDGVLYVTGPEQWQDGKVLRTKWTTAPKRIAPDNSIFITVKGAGVGKMAFGVECAIGRDVYAFEPSPLLNDKFIFWAIKEGVNEIVLKAQGDIPGLSKAHILEHEIRLPPINEQRRIVEKIEAMFDEIDAGIQSLQTARTTLGLYRQSLLKSAFEGRLTADWRAQNADQLEAPETLLARIQAERDTRYKTALDNWQDALAEWRANGEKGKKPAKPKRIKPPEKFTLKQLDSLPLLPDSWSHTKIGFLAQVGTGVTPLKSNKAFYNPPEIPWVTSGAVNASYVEKPGHFVSRQALEETNLQIYPSGTLILAMYGEGKTRGKCSELKFESTTNQALAAIQVERVEHFLKPYLKMFLLKNYQDMRLLSSGGVQPNLNLGIVENHWVPICSPAEQAEIVRILDARLEAADALEAEIDAALTRADALRQSILKKAFSGQLVPQDPIDEPASALLERIKAERLKAPKKTRKRAPA